VVFKHFPLRRSHMGGFRMCIAFARLIGSVSVAFFLLLAVPMPASAGDMSPIATTSNGIAIQGYDTVAYFTEGKAIKGSSLYEYDWADAKWWFASSAHREMFAADPDRYMPQFGGFCSGAVTIGMTVPANPEAWAIVDGKLYMVAGSEVDIAEWQAAAAENIKQGNKQWPMIRTRWAPQNQ